MSRPLRIEYPGAWTHVMNRGDARQKIFQDDADDDLLELVRKRQLDRGFAKRLDRLVRQIDGSMEPVIHC